MGVWGNKLYQNDIALDVKDSYKELLQDGKRNIFETVLNIELDKSFIKIPVT